MTKVIMILIIWQQALATAEFDDMDACQSAVAIAKEKAQSGTYFNAFCVPKSSQPK